MNQFVSKGIISSFELMDLLLYLKFGGSNWITVSPCTVSDTVPEGISPTNWRILYARKCYWVVINNETLLTVKQAQAYKMTVVELHSKVEFEPGEGLAENLKLILASNWQYSIKDIACIDSQRRTSPDSTSTWGYNIDCRSPESVMWGYLDEIAQADIKGTIQETKVWLKNYTCLTLKVQEPGKSYWEISEQAIPFPDWFRDFQKPSFYLDPDLIVCMTVKVYSEISDTFSNLQLKVFNVNQRHLLKEFLEELDQIASHIGGAYDEPPTIIKGGEVISLLEVTVWCEDSELDTHPEYHKLVLRMSHPLDPVEWVSEGMEEIPAELK